MLLVSLLAYKFTMPPLGVAALQHLAAGIVTSAVAVELVPLVMVQPKSHIWAIVVGFSMGIGFFLLLGCLFPEEDENEEDEEESFDPPEDRPRKKSKVGKMREAQVDRAPLLNTQYEAQVKKGCPLQFTFAVLVDSAVDGFLIGITAALSANHGSVMVVALTIEMAFLAMTYATALQHMPISKSIPLILLPSIILVIGAVAGAELADTVSGTKGVTMLLSFGIAALLFLVTEELLIAAHESTHSEGGHIWWVDLMFFLGFLISFVLEKFSKK